MIAPSFRTRFPRQLRFWTFHGLINARPILIFIMTTRPFPIDQGASSAMASAIITLIILCSVLTSLNGPLADPNHLLSRALRLGCGIRASICGISALILLIHQAVITFTPDAWCGLAGYLGAAYLTIPGFSFNDLAYGIGGNFLTFYLATLFTGLLLLFLLLMISFFAAIYLQAADRRKFVALADRDS